MRSSRRSPGPLTIANEPLGAPAGLILPNIMFILDDSGSMDSDYLPEFVNEVQNLSVNTTAACADTGDESGSGNLLGAIDGEPDRCMFGDPPYNSPDFNYIYYNPGIYYQPGVNVPNAATGAITDMPIMNRANTNNWTQVPVHPYTADTFKDLVNNIDVTVMNLASGFPDRVWCTGKAEVGTGGTCRQNSGYQYPDSVFPFGQDNGNKTKYIGVSPYYYRMQSAQYCTTGARDVCVSGSSINLNAAAPPTHTFQAPEYCTDQELTNCAAGAAVTAAHVFSGPRWCADAGTLPNCRRKKIQGYIYPKHLGVTQSQTCSAASPCNALSNQGSIHINAVDPAGGSITALTIAGVSVISGPITVPANSTVIQVRDQIIAAINTFPAPTPPTPAYTATPSGHQRNHQAERSGLERHGRPDLGYIQYRG